MLRNRIQWLGALALATVLMLLTAESASAQLRERLRNRFGRTSEPVYYYDVAPMTTSSQVMPATTTQPAGDMPRYVRPYDSRSGYYFEERPTYSRPRLFGRFGRRYSEPVYSYGPSTFAPAAPSSTAAPESGRQSFYPPDSLTALIEVHVPAQAEILIDGQRTTSLGPTRQFVTPQLERGSRYKYEIQAKWMENGREVVKTQKVEFQAGDRKHVHFPPDPVPGGTPRTP